MGERRRVRGLHRALTEAVLARCSPAAVTGIDPSAGFVEYAAEHVVDARATFRVGGVDDLAPASVDVVVSGLVLNFLPDAAAAVGVMRRAAAGGVVAAYVWDYAEGMQMLRLFWDAASELDPDAAALDEGVRFGLCRPGRLESLWREAGLVDVSCRAFDLPTVFADVDDYWRPFTAGQGPAPGYVVGLDTGARERLRDLVVSRLPVAADGSVSLGARAWAVKGRSPS